MVNGAFVLVIALALGAANIVGVAVPERAGFPQTAQFDGQRYGGPSIRFARAVDRSIAYELDYGVGWRPSGNLSGAELSPREQITTIYVDHYLYVFIVAEGSGVSYWKRCDPDAGIDNWTVEWRRWSP